MQFYSTITAIRQLSPKVKAFVLDYDKQDFTYHPGQWVDIHLTIDDETHNCGYSITSIPSDKNSIEIAVKLAPDLALTEQLHKHCKIGDQIFISKAQGKVYLTNDFSGPHVFIAGGVGITPLYSMIQFILDNKPDTPITLLYSITTPEEFLFETEIRNLEQTHPDFRCYVTVTRTTTTNGKFNGRIGKSILTAVNLPKKANYYLCGPPSMVDNVAGLLEELQTELSITKDNVHYDKWWS